MHAHRIEIFNRADDDDVVRQVAHHLEFEFLPAENRFFDQDFVNWRSRQPTPDDFFKLLRIEGGATTGAAERERGPDYGRIISLLNDRFGFGPRPGKSPA